MLAILICLTYAFLPNLTSLAAHIETQSAIFAVAVFSFLLFRLRFNSRLLVSGPRG
jgi:hypothetical protein